MSRNLIAIKLKIQKIIRVHINTKNKSGATILFETKIAIIYLFLQKTLTQTHKWLIFIN